MKKALLTTTIGAICLPCAVMAIGALDGSEAVFASTNTAIEYTAPTVKENLTYNGQEQDIINPGVVPDGYTMVYRVGFDDDTETTEIPTGFNWGGYYVDYKIIDGFGSVVVGYDETLSPYIEKATLIVTAEDFTMEQYDWESMDNFTYTVEGFFENDYFDEYGEPQFAYFGDYETVGEYELAFDESCGSAENYTIKYVSGKITVYEHTECRGGEKPTCAGYMCALCDGYYGEKAEGAHSWSADSGKCYHCEEFCAHEAQTLYCMGSFCDTCGYNCDETTKDENAHKWNKWGNCWYCGDKCSHESFDESTAVCDVCKAVAKDVAVIVGDSTVLYDDLFDAIENAPENATIKLLREIILFKNYQIDKTITLDLNGQVIETPSLYLITINAPIVIMDSVGGGRLDVGIRFNATCVLKGGEYRSFYSSVEGKSPSDFLGKGYHFYQNSDGVGKDTPLTDEEVKNAYYIWVLLDCEHTGGEATCAKKAVCSVCGNEYGEKKECVYGDWVITKEPTTTEKGEKTQACDDCGDTKTEELPYLESTDDNTPVQGGGDEGGNTEKAGCGSVVSCLPIIGLAMGVLCVVKKRKE